MRDEEQALVPANQEQNSLSKKQAAKDFLKLAGPFVTSRFIGAASEMGGSFMLSRLGSDALEASNLITVYGNFIITSLVVSLYSTGILEKRALADNKKAEVGALMQRSYLYAISTGLIGSAILYFTSDVLKLTGQSTIPSDLAGDYLRAFAISGGLIGTLTSVGSQQTAYALGKANLVLGVNVIRRAVYMGLAYCLIFGEAGFPKLGVAGLGYARAISSNLDQLIFLAYYYKNRDLKDYRLLRVGIKETLTDFGMFLKKSLNVGAQTFNELMENFIGTILIGLRGAEGLAASEVSTQYGTLFNIPILTATQASAILVGKHKNNIVNARTMGNVSIALSMVIPVIAIPLLIAARSPLTSLFVKSNEENHAVITDLAETFLIYTAFMVMINTVRSVASGALRGLDHFAIPLITSILSVTMFGLGLGAGLDYAAGLGAQAIYIGNVIGVLAGAIYLAKYWKNLTSTKEPVEHTATSVASNENYGATAQSPAVNRYAHFSNGVSKKSDGSQIKESVDGNGFYKPSLRGGINDE